MFNTLFDGNHVTFPIAIAAGFITFFASCLLPLVPTYLAYLSGTALRDDATKTQRWRIFKMASLFVLGFVSTFVFLGFSVTFIGIWLQPYQLLIERLAGILFILLGLYLLGVFKSTTLSTERKISVEKLFIKHRHIHAVLTGMAFGFGWSPCIGPVLAVILFWASRTATHLEGILLLLSYGIGLGIPFLLIGLAFEKILPVLHRYKKVTHYATIISALIILVVGVLLAIGRFEYISLWLLELTGLRVLAV